MQAGQWEKSDIAKYWIVTVPDPRNLVGGVKGVNRSDRIFVYKLHLQI
jgi:hypothetical protein